MDVQWKYTSVYEGTAREREQDSLRTLGSYITDASPSVLLNICLQLVEISQGLQYLHEEGIVHGDLRGVSMVLCILLNELA